MHWVVWNSREARSIGLVVTGLTVSFVRQGIQHRWRGFAPRRGESR
jgi:hypothetical protein